MYGYRVERRPHGVLIFGSVPISDLTGLMKTWKKDGFTVMDAGIASAERALMAVTSEDGSEKWRKEIESRLSSHDEELQWLLGVDTGTSSKTIFSVLSKHQSAAQAGLKPDVPHDPDDFGRCHRLLERFPAWRARLPEVAAKHPSWKPVVEAWGELTALYVEESPSGTCPKLYARMQSLRVVR